MIIWAKIKAWKDTQKISYWLTLGGHGVGKENTVFLRFNTYLHNAYYVPGIILGVL